MNVSHGRSKDPIHNIWRGMKARCNNPRNPAFRHYGARGIAVCESWNGKHGFENFLADMGERPTGAELERKDNSLGYGKDNCIWANRVVQNNNTRQNRLLTFEGRTQTLAQWAKELKINYGTLHDRITYRGWSTAKALTTPAGRQGQKLGA